MTGKARSLIGRAFLLFISRMKKITITILLSILSSLPFAGPRPGWFGPTTTFQPIEAELVVSFRTFLPVHLQMSQKPIPALDSPMRGGIQCEHEIN